MARAIDPYLEQIRSAVYGEQVRGSIISSLEKCYDDSTAAGQIAAIKAAGRETLDTIPETYTDLENRVETAAEALNELSMYRRRIGMITQDDQPKWSNITEPAADNYRHVIVRVHEGDVVTIKGNGSQTTYYGVLTDYNIPSFDDYDPANKINAAMSAASGFTKRMSVGTTPKTMTMPSDAVWLLLIVKWNTDATPSQLIINGIDLCKGLSDTVSEHSESIENLESDVGALNTDVAEISETVKTIKSNVLDIPWQHGTVKQNVGEEATYQSPDSRIRHVTAKQLYFGRKTVLTVATGYLVRLIYVDANNIVTEVSTYQAFKNYEIDAAARFYMMISASSQSDDIYDLDPSTVVELVDPSNKASLVTIRESIDELHSDIDDLELDIESIRHDVPVQIEWKIGGTNTLTIDQKIEYAGSTNLKRQTPGVQLYFDYDVSLTVDDGYKVNVLTVDSGDIIQAVTGYQTHKEYTIRAGTRFWLILSASDNTQAIDQVVATDVVDLMPVGSGAMNFDTIREELDDMSERIDSAWKSPTLKVTWIKGTAKQNAGQEEGFATNDTGNRLTSDKKAQYLLDYDVTVNVKEGFTLILIYIDNSTHTVSRNTGYRTFEDEEIPAGTPFWFVLACVDNSKIVLDEMQTLYGTDDPNDIVTFTKSSGLINFEVVQDEIDSLRGSIPVRKWLALGDSITEKYYSYIPTEEGNTATYAHSYNTQTHVGQFFYRMINGVRKTYISKAAIAVGDTFSSNNCEESDEQHPWGRSGTDAKLVWDYYVAKQLGWELTNMAIGGTGFIHYSGGQRTPDMAGCNKVKTINFSQYDLVTIAFGINDWKGKQVLGDLDSDPDDVDANNIPKTICGGIKSIIRTITASNPYCKIIFVTPLNGVGYSYAYKNSPQYARSYQEEDTTHVRRTLDDVTDAIITICEYYGIQYIDNTRYSFVNIANMNQWDDNGSNLLFPDGIHPSLDAHKVLAKEMAKKLTF